MSNKTAQQPTKPSRKHKLEWLALKGVIHYIRRGSLASTPKKIGRLTPLLQKILRSERLWADRNLQLIYGHALSETEREVLVRLIFENVLLSHLEGMQIDGFQFEDHGVNHLKEAIQLGRGVIACSIHLGSWEPGLKHFAQLAAPSPTAIVYRHANNPLSEAEFIKIRASYGVEWIRRDQPRQIIKAIQEKKLLGLMTDMNTRVDGVTAPFLGVPAQSPAGPARLALRFGAPILPLVSIRQAPGQAKFIIFPALEPQKKAKPSLEDVVALTTKINDTFTETIHQHAEQYNWLHARWRTREEGTLWKTDTPIELMQCARPDPLAPYPEIAQRVLEQIEQRLK
ncbi:MAG: lysophospholipid acyltransferase family protein [Magnetococcales bacterium]|nr:lysophospholipid acyltransferase family protein [Magnetococcales bacterium]